MIKRRFWIDLIEQTWAKRSVIWLAGVRRSGKTVLCRSLPNVEYFDCELPSVRRALQDPELALAGLAGKRIVLDEIHRLKNPSELLKIAADHHRGIRIIATGSSVLSASRKFRDTLTGRKRDLWLTPMCMADLADAPGVDLPRRLYRGGLPEFLLTENFEFRDFQDWVEAYWAKDVQELFRLEKKDPSQRFTELVMAQTGGIFEATRFARPCEVSRPTIANYLRALEATFVAHVLRPFNTRRSAEIISAPKVYAFDTGFVCYSRGWQTLRAEDFGDLWEHFVLNELTARLQTRDICYWRDKRGHEIDFVLARRRAAPMAIECKWNADAFAPENLQAFRRLHPKGENFVAGADVKIPYSRDFGDLLVHFLPLDGLVNRIAQETSR